MRICSTEHREELIHCPGLVDDMSGGKGESKAQPWSNWTAGSAASVGLFHGSVGGQSEIFCPCRPMTITEQRSQTMILIALR